MRRLGVYAWKQAPLGERIGAPIVREILASANRRALARLADHLRTSLGPAQ